MAIAVRQVKTFTVSGEDGKCSVPLTALAAGTPTITATFNRNGYNSVTWALFEIEKCVTSSGADKGHSDMVN